MQEPFKIEDALHFLKQGEIVKTLSLKPIYFIYDQDKILAHSEQAHLHLSLEDFISIYSIEKFRIHQSIKEAEVSIEKDIEYYQWKK